MINETDLLQLEKNLILKQDEVAKALRAVRSLISEHRLLKAIFAPNYLGPHGEAIPPWWSYPSRGRTYKYRCSCLHCDKIVFGARHRIICPACGKRETLVFIHDSGPESYARNERAEDPAGKNTQETSDADDTETGPVVREGT
ncbi:hypothetical protein LCGC14_0734790 [marine sediment metagenome]|uniref:Uncharacterized protein n=1 Tax=marine sediment metagenome TaxID=412755 RepID=A0A0F9QTK0_9ZZZZ